MNVVEQMAPACFEGGGAWSESRLRKSRCLARSSRRSGPRPTRRSFELFVVLRQVLARELAVQDTVRMGIVTLSGSLRYMRHMCLSLTVW